MTSTRHAEIPKTRHAPASCRAWRDARPVRTAQVAAPSAPAHKRVTLPRRVRIGEALLLRGRAKGPFLEAFGAYILFDDSTVNTESVRRHVETGHVPRNGVEGNGGHPDAK